MWKDYLHFCSVPESQAYFQLFLYLVSVLTLSLYTVSHYFESCAVQESSFSLHPVLGRDEIYLLKLILLKATGCHEVAWNYSVNLKSIIIGKPATVMFWVTFTINDGIECTEQLLQNPSKITLVGNWMLQNITLTVILQILKYGCIKPYNIANILLVWIQGLYTTCLHGATQKSYSLY